MRNFLGFMNNEIVLHNLTFIPYLSASKLAEYTKNVADSINSTYQNEHIVLVPILNGSFLFAADLVRQLTVSCEVEFVKVQSYEGTESTGAVRELIGLKQEHITKKIILVEDIVDTGNTLTQLKTQLINAGAEHVVCASLLFKPNAYKYSTPPEFVGIEIPNDFVVGYGLDYDGLGRNLPDLYVLKPNS